MGKGSNVQKAQAARERNQKKMGKSDEERRLAKAKVAKDVSAFMCGICRQTFMVNAQPPTLYLHVTSKHEAGTDPVKCFPCLAGYDPDDPKGLKKAAAEKKKKADIEAKKKNKKNTVDDLAGMLDAGLKMGKKGKNKFK